MNALQPVRALIIEAMYPVAQGLPVHAADPRRIGAAHAIQYGRQRQQPAALLAVLAVLGKLAQARRRIVRAQFNG